MPVTIAVLANDSDPDGDPISVSAVTQPGHGSVVINGSGPNNTVTYTSSTGFAGSDSFNYTVSDGKGGTATGHVSVTVSAAVNHNPTANNDSATTIKNTPVKIAVLANDTDPDGDPLIVTAVTAPAHGSAVINGDNTVTYTPSTGYLGGDSFRYTVSDGRGGTAMATVNVTVNPPPNRPPDAMDDSATTPKNTQVTIDVLANDSDPDGDSLTVASVTQPFNGTATRTSSNVTYKPNNGFVGTDSFTYTVSDGRGGTATATVTVFVSDTTSTPGKVTGGGWIPGTGGNGKSNFGVNGQLQKGAASGHVNYDSSNGAVSLSGEVETLTVSGTSGDLSGPCTMDKKSTPCRYSLHVEDKGEPGTGKDRFRILVYDSRGNIVHQADALLGGGNIQVH
jgi:hypothetical protein